MQAIAGTKVALHPHIKTHEPVAPAKRQIAGGAQGIAASHAREAAAFARSGFSSVHP